VGGPLNSQARNCLGKGDPKFDVTMPNHQKEEEEEVASNGILILCNVETHFSIILLFYVFTRKT
jgi:hypothetical protein